MDLGLKGKVALVAGASQGMGRATALGFAREGAKVAICARGETALNEAAEFILQSELHEHHAHDPRSGAAHAQSR
jgi:3-oxoacyl-[acyl-carrier protein] reductase